MRALTHSTLTPALALSVLVWTVGCGDSESPADAGPGIDAAADTGVAVDTGTGPADTGTEPADTGTGPADTGFTPGDAITATPGVWTWVGFPNSNCMNSTPTGIGVNLNSDEKVVIYLQGGNACFNNGSCMVVANPDGYGEGKFNNDGFLGAPMFSRTAAQNPLQDWSYVYVPYCTGDVHAGDNPAGIAGGVNRNFAGFTNMTQFLERLVPTFPNAKEVLLSGASAGAFGAVLNFDQVQTAFGPNVKVTLFSDSGPPMRDQYLAPCLQKHFRDTFGFDNTLPSDCTECFAGDSFTEEYTRYLLAKYTDRNFAFVSSNEDNVIRGFWGFGENNCASLPGVFPDPYSGPKFQAGLEDLRDNVLDDYGNAKLYMPTDTRHTWLGSALWTQTHHGVVMSDWMVQALTDDPNWTHAPTN